MNPTGKLMREAALDAAKGYKTLSLREAGEFDKQNGAREKVGPWGKFCALRHKQKKGEA